jgi:hypothetical protein
MCVLEFLNPFLRHAAEHVREAEVSVDIENDDPETLDGALKFHNGLFIVAAIVEILCEVGNRDGGRVIGILPDLGLGFVQAAHFCK